MKKRILLGASIVCLGLLFFLRASDQIHLPPAEPGSGLGYPISTAFMIVETNTTELFRRTALIESNAPVTKATGPYQTLQFKDTNGLFGGDQNLTWDRTNLNLGGSLMLGGSIKSTNSNNGPLNVLSFNADPTGTSDSTAAIQAAINTVQQLPGGGTVYFPAGRYSINQTLLVSSNVEVTLRGESTFGSCYPLSGSIIQLAPLANCDMLQKMTTARVNLKGLVFYGNSTNETKANLHGIWLQGSPSVIARCLLEDLIVWGVHGVGIQNDNRETHMVRVRADQNDGDGIQNTASSDVSMSNIDSGFNGGNGVNFLGANYAVMVYGNIYGNMLNGVLLTNANSVRLIDVQADANSMNGILVAGLSWHNELIACKPFVSNFYQDRWQQPTTIPSGTYSNLRIDGSNACDLTLIGGQYFAYEDQLATKPKYLIEDNRTGFFATNKYFGITISGARFTQNTNCFAAAAYDPSFRTNAAPYSTWTEDEVTQTQPNLNLLGQLSVTKLLAYDQINAQVGWISNARFSDQWRYISNGPAYYMKSRYDDPQFAIEYASPGTSGTPLTWTNALTLNSTNGNVGIGIPGNAVSALEIGGNAKAATFEAGSGIAVNAYYTTNGWAYRNNGMAFLLLPGFNGNAFSILSAPSGAANAAFNFNAVSLFQTNGDVYVPGNLIIGNQPLTNALRDARGRPIPGTLSTNITPGGGLIFSNFLANSGYITNSLSAGTLQAATNLSGYAAVTNNLAVGGAITAASASITNLNIGTLFITNITTAGTMTASNFLGNSATVTNSLAAGAVSAGSATVTNSLNAGMIATGSTSVTNGLTAGSINAASLGAGSAVITNSITAASIGAGSLNAGGSTVTNNLNAGSIGTALLNAGSISVTNNLNAGSVSSPLLSGNTVSAGSVNSPLLSVNNATVTNNLTAGSVSAPSFSAGSGMITNSLNTLALNANTATITNSLTVSGNAGLASLTAGSGTITNGLTIGGTATAGTLQANNANVTNNLQAANLLANSVTVTNAITATNLLYRLKDIFIQPTGVGVTITTNQSGFIFSNQGATSAPAFTLPATAPGLTYSFVIHSSGGAAIIPAAGSTIRLAGSQGTAGGYVSSTVIGDFLTLVAINSTNWYALSQVGTGWATH